MRLSAKKAILLYFLKISFIGVVYKLKDDKIIIFPGFGYHSQHPNLPQKCLHMAHGNLFFMWSVVVNNLKFNCMIKDGGAY